MRCDVVRPIHHFRRLGDLNHARRDLFFLKLASQGQVLDHMPITITSFKRHPAVFLRRVLGPEVQNGSEDDHLSAIVPDDARVAAALTELAGAGVRLAEFSLGQPTLDEVFFALTGRPAEDQTRTPDGEEEEE